MEEPCRVEEQDMKENKGRKNNNNLRRKSFEVWLTEKENQIIKEMNVKAMRKKEESLEEWKRRQQRHGKSHEVWLEEKSREGARKHAWIERRASEEHREADRRRISQERYDKWLFEKEMEALRKEQNMLRDARKKTTMMRKKFTEREQNGVDWT